MREPGSAAKTAKTGLTIAGAASPAIGATIGAIVTGPFAPLGAFIGGLIGLALGAGASAIDPKRAANRNALMQQGLSKPYADEYYRSQKLDDAQLMDRAGQLHDRAARGNFDALEQLAAIRTLRAERGASAAQQTAAMLAQQGRSGRIPLWAPASFLAIVALGILAATRRSAR